MVGCGTVKEFGKKDRCGLLETMETKNYYILELRFHTLMRIFSAGRNSRINHVTYVEITRTASLLLKFLKKMKMLSFTMLNAKPRLTPQALY